MSLFPEGDTPALALHGISKRFGSIVALESVSLTARHNSIHALLGENGAGKTTLMRVAFGLVHPDAGTITIEGRTQTIASPADAIAAGIGMVHQQFSLVPAMSVAENVALGGKGIFDREAIARRIDEVGRRTGLTLNPSARVADLGSAERQKLEIIRTFAHDARILILDEPTAVLTPKDTGELFTQLRAFADAGGTVILITHKLRDALAYADEVTVLRNGHFVLNAPMSSATIDSLTSAMLGTTPDLTKTSNAGRSSSRRKVASLDAIAMANKHVAEKNTATLEVFAGEVLGVAALEGRAAFTLRALAGRVVPESGSVDIPDHVGFVPENRGDEGIVLDFTLTENLALRNLQNRKGLLDWTSLRRTTRDIIQDFDIRADTSESPARTLSGGNQQRFILAKELEDKPPLLVLENPTQGLDVKAAAAIHQRIRDAAANGTAVVFYSSDLDELAELSNRVLVVRSSGLVFSAPDRDTIGRLLLEADIAVEHHG